MNEPFSNADTSASASSVAAASENLRFAVNDHQEMIRGTDLKGEVLGIAITGLLTVIAFEGSVSTTCLNGWIGIGSVACSLVAFVFVGLVLWPRTDPWRAVSIRGYTPSRVMYPPAEADPARDVQCMARDAIGTNWPAELSFELAKLAVIRAAKQNCFRWALGATGLAILLVSIRLFVPPAPLGVP